MTAKPVVSDAMVSTAVDAALRHQVIAALVGDTGSSDISTLDGAVRELMGEHAELVRMVDRADARIAELEAENDAVDTGRPEALNALLSAVAASLPEQTVEERLDGAERAYRRARRVAVRSTRRVEGLIGAVDALTTQLAEARTRIVELEAERTSTARLINNAMRTQNDAPLAVEVLVNTFASNRDGLFRVEHQRDEARAQAARVRAKLTELSIESGAPEPDSVFADPMSIAAWSRAWDAARVLTAREALATLDGPGLPTLRLFEPGGGPILRIEETFAGRTLLTLDVVDGKLTAIFDTADLDEAAALFVRELARIGEYVVSGPTVAVFGSVASSPLDPDLTHPSWDEAVRTPGVFSDRTVDHDCWPPAPDPLVRSWTCSTCKAEWEPGTVGTGSQVFGEGWQRSDTGEQVMLERWRPERDEDAVTATDD